MKKIVLFGIIMLSVLSNFAQVSKAKTRKEIRKEKAEKRAARVDSILTSGSFYIDINSAHSSLLNTVHLNDLYYIRLTADSIFTYLPYYGRAYRADFSNTNGGIDLSTTHSELATDKTKKNIVYSFSAKSEFDTYQFTISITTSGYVSVNVSSMNRQAIRYNGELSSAPN